MKGKKFDASQKHFEKEEVRLRREINRLIAESEKYKKEFEKCNSELIATNEELSELKAKYQKLLEYSKLSEEDIKKAIKSDEALQVFAGLLKFMN